MAEGGGGCDCGEGGGAVEGDSGGQETYHGVVERHGGSVGYLLSCRPRDWLEEFAEGVCCTWCGRARLLPGFLSIVAVGCAGGACSRVGPSTQDGVACSGCTQPQVALRRTCDVFDFGGPEAFETWQAPQRHCPTVACAR